MYICIHSLIGMYPLVIHTCVFITMCIYTTSETATIHICTYRSVDIKYWIYISQKVDSAFVTGWGEFVYITMCMHPYVLLCNCHRAAFTRVHPHASCVHPCFIIRHMCFKKGTRMQQIHQ